MRSKKILAIVFLCTLTFASYGQHSGKDALHGNAHKLTVVMAHSHIPNALDENRNLIIPAWGLNYDYIFHHRWGVGIHSELLLQQFKIESHSDNKELIRENPVSISGVITFKPHHKWSVLAGGGVELESEENIAVLKTGIEYGIELINDWELGLSFELDHKIDTYNSWLFGVGFSKLFYKKDKNQIH
jgi:hypothetical protein